MPVWKKRRQVLLRKRNECFWYSESIEKGNYRLLPPPPPERDDRADLDEDDPADLDEDDPIDLDPEDDLDWLAEDDAEEREDSGDLLL